MGPHHDVREATRERTAVANTGQGVAGRAGGGGAPLEAGVTPAFVAGGATADGTTTGGTTGTMTVGTGGTTTVGAGRGTTGAGVLTGDGCAVGITGTDAVAVGDGEATGLWVATGVA